MISRSMRLKPPPAPYTHSLSKGGAPRPGLKARRQITLPHDVGEAVQLSPQGGNFAAAVATYHRSNRDGEGA